MPRELSDIRELLAEKDLRLTPQREAILRVLVKHADLHLSADEIYRRTKEECPDIGLATVYRALEVFENLGIIHKLQFGEEGSRYEFNPEFQKHYHHHLICLSCGGISEFNEDLLDDIEEAISERTGFDIVDHSLRVYGYCRQCQAAARGAREAAQAQDEAQTLTQPRAQGEAWRHPHPHPHPYPYPQSQPQPHSQLSVHPHPDSQSQTGPGSGESGANTRDDE